MRPELAGRLLFVVIVLALPIGFASLPRIFDDGDVSWHIATGEWIFRHRAIPTVDPFSFTAAGEPWVAMEWLADILFASGYTLTGYAGLATIVAAALIALHAILFIYLQRRVGPIALVAAFLAMDLVLSPFILARPHVLVWPLLAGWTVILLRAVEKEQAPPLWAALIMLVWTNIHGSFPLGIVIAGAFAIDAMLASRWKRLPQWSALIGASIVCALLNANGVAGLLHPFKIAGLEMLPLIQEWRPSDPSITPQFYLVVLAGLAGMLAAGIRIPLGRLALLLSMLGLAFLQVRHQSWFIIVAAAVVPTLFPAQAAPVGGLRLLGLMALPILALRALLPMTPAENATNPRQLIAHVPTELRNQAVLNGYAFGGPLILAGIKPYIDGRADMYGDAHFSDYREIAQGDANRFNWAVRRYGIRWTMLQESQKRLIQLLDSSPEWRRVYSNKAGVIHARVD
jgi:hypothetical protein